MTLKKNVFIILCVIMLLSLLTACTNKIESGGEEKNSDGENSNISKSDNDNPKDEISEDTDESGNVGTSPDDDKYKASDFDIDRFLDYIDDMFPAMINTTPVPFTQERVVGADSEWPWAVVEIGWNGYGDENKWQRYQVIDDEDEYYPPEETQHPSTEPEPPPPTAQHDPAYYAEPDKNMLYISTNKWPAAYLPPGVPVYPDGDFDIDAGPGDVMLYIYNSSMASLMKYLDMLKDAGWRVEGEPEYFVMGGKGLWWFQTACYDGSNVMLQFMYDEWGM